MNNIKNTTIISIIIIVFSFIIGLIENDFFIGFIALSSGIFNI